MRSTRSVAFGVITFLLAMLIHSSFSRANLVHAYTCEVRAGRYLVRCCETEADGIRYCTYCDNTKPPSNCTRRSPDSDITGGNNPVPKSPPPIASTEPPPVAPPVICPDGSAPDANGKCPPTDQGTTLPPPENHKGSNIGQLGGSLVNGDNNINKPSKHHKGGDTLTPPPLTTDQGTQ